MTSSEPATLNGSAAPVAVRAADLALIQLIDKVLRTATASDKPCDVFRLRLEMIKLKNERVCKAAVDARRFAKTLQYDADIAPICCHARAREFDLAVFDKCQLAMGQSLTRRVALVTIRA